MIEESAAGRAHLIAMLRMYKVTPAELESGVSAPPTSSWVRTQMRRKKPHWLYRMYDAEGSLLYVGQTFDQRKRIEGWRSVARRHTTAAWFNNVARTTWTRYADWESVCVAERDAIRAERPRHNIVYAVEAAS